MTDRERAAEKARDFFEDLWRQGDYWDFERSPFERERYARLVALLEGRHYPRVLELGCGAGQFTGLLCPLAGSVIALDISPTAIARARASRPEPGVNFRVANMMDYDLRGEGPWDLIVMSETIYYLGWLFPFVDVAWLAAELFAMTRARGRLLLVNTEGGVEDGLIRPWLIRAYHDLFWNVGYRLETEEVFRGSKEGVDIDVLISLFLKDSNGTDEQ